MTPEQMARLVAGDFDCHDYVEINVGGTGPNEADFETLDTPGVVIRELATAITTLQQEKAALDGEITELKAHQLKTTGAWRRAEERIVTQEGRLGQKIADYVSELATMRDRAEQLENELAELRKAVEKVILRPLMTSEAKQLRAGIAAVLSVAEVCTCGHGQAAHSLSGSHMRCYFGRCQCWDYTPAPRRTEVE